MNKTGLLAVTALLLSACTPSLNLQVALPEIRPPGFDVALAASDTLGPAPLTAVFTADARESASYAWFVNDRELARERANLTYTFDKPGVYEVTVAATNAVGETDTESVTVEVTEDAAVDSL